MVVFYYFCCKDRIFLLSSKDLAINFKTKRKETEADDFRFLFLSLENRSKTSDLFYKRTFSIPPCSSALPRR